MSPITKAAAGFASITLRGGRITKWHGQAASCAPQVGSLGTGAIAASASTLAIGAALGAVMLTPSAAQAGQCAETVPGSLVFECTGPENASNDVTQLLVAAAGESVLIETQPGFGLAVSGSPAFDITGASGSGSITLRDRNNNASRFLGRGGITINHSGTGAVDLEVSALVLGTQVGSSIFVDSRGSGISVVAREVSAPRGVYVIGRGTGDISITTTGLVTGTVFEGIYAATTSSTGALSITANDVTGGSDAIRASASGAGATTITTTGTVAGGTNGIAVRDYGPGDLMITTSGAVSGGANGILISDYGAGNIVVNATGPVSATNVAGINIDKEFAGARLGDITVNAVDTSSIFGIRVRQNGTGDLSITSTGTATGLGNGIGIEAFSLGGDVTIASQTATGGYTGIRVRGGIGETSITADTTTGGAYGIKAYSGGTGGLAITTSGVTTATNATDGTAIQADSNGSLAITTNGATIGGARGIAFSQVGAATITTNQAVEGTSAAGIEGNIGQYGYGSGGTTTITSNAAVRGGTDGILIRDYGTGDVQITASGDVTGTSGSAIRVIKDYAGARLGDIAISAVNTSGGASGIEVFQQGEGALSITSTGTANGAGVHGINANSYGNGLTITSQEAVGANTGIRLAAFGATGADSVTSHTATGGQSGIVAGSASRDGLTVTTTGATTGGSGTGLVASNSRGDVVINAQGAVSGGYDGIFGSSNDGSGTLTITASAPVTGTARHGIAAYAQRNAAARIEITAGDVSGGESAIFAYADPVNGIAITLSGTAQGGSGAAIDTITGAGALSTITITDTAGALAGSSGVAIRNDAGDSLVDVAGTIGGDVRLGEGSDTLNIAAGAVLQTGLVLDGGDTASAADGMIDTLNFNGWNGVLAGSNLTNWEAINLNTGTELRLTGGTLVTGDAGDLATGLFVNTGATLDLGGVGLALTGNLFNDGTITMANGIAGDVLAVSGDYVGTGNGVIGLDTNFFTNISDRLTVGGAVSGGITTLGISDVSTGTASGSAVLVVEVQGASPAGVFMLGRGPITVDGQTYSLEQQGNNWLLTAICTAPGGCSAVTPPPPPPPPPPSGTIDGDLAGSPANPIVTVDQDTTVTGTVSGGATGPDARNFITIDTTGTVGAVAGDAGDDQIWLLGGTVLGNVASGEGDDRIMLNGGSVAGAIDAGNGNTAVNLMAGSAGSVQSGMGNDVVQLGGATIAGAIDTGAGDDTIVLIAGSAGSVLAGAGNDTLNWNSAAAITPLINMGAGNDVLNINDAAIGLANVVLNGGTGANTLNLNNGWSGALAGANTLGWQSINVNGGTLFVNDGAITAGTLTIGNGGTLNASNSLVVNGNLAVSAGSMLIAGNNTGTNRPVVRGNLSNAGTIDLRSPTGVVAAGDILTVEGDYITLANNLRLDAVLGGNHLSDQVVVRGNLIGTGMVTISNAGGTGALTTGDGIRLVQVDGSSANGSLALAGGTIDVGAFRYGLFAGGIANPGDQDWYLRSRARDIVMPTISMARVSQDLGLTALGTLNERVGEQARIGGAGDESGVFTGAWLRAFGKSGPETIISAAFGDTRSDAQMGGLQMGVDVLRSVASDGSRTVLGLTAGAMWAGTRDFAGAQRAARMGQSNSDGFVIGAYATHYAPSGFYVDAVLQHDWLDHTISAVDGTRADTDSRTFIASLEMGHAFGSLWQIEPQAQLIYAATSVDGFTDSSRVANSVSVDDSVIGRAGLRLKRSFAGDETTGAGRVTIYGKGNLWHRLSGGGAAFSVGVSAPGAVFFRESWGDVGAGVSVGIGPRAEFFADGEVEFGLDQSGTAVAGRTGIRLRF